MNDHVWTEIQRRDGMTGRDSAKNTSYEVSLVPVGSSLARVAQRPEPSSPGQRTSDVLLAGWLSWQESACPTGPGPP